MTGRAARNQGSSPNVDNRRDSVVKNFLLSGSRRLSSSAQHLTEFHKSDVRGHEDVNLTSDKESSFIDQTPLNSTAFLMRDLEPSGRFRTSSLTMDTSCAIRKEIDSGNSSLVDSSSAHSYQEFGSSGRSRTTSSSKSDHSLTSLNTHDYQMASHRKRHSSVSDSNSGSSGKVSLSASDVTEISEEYQPPASAKVTGFTSKTYVCETTVSDSESQPFLYLPFVESSDADFDVADVSDVVSVRGSEDANCQDLISKSSNYLFDSGIRRGHKQYVNDKPFHQMTTHCRDRNDYSFMRSSVGERTPLMATYGGQFEKESCDLEDLFHPESCTIPLRRSASLSNISNQRVNGHCPTPETKATVSTPEISEISSVSTDITTSTLLDTWTAQHCLAADGQPFNCASCQSNNRTWTDQDVNSTGSSTVKTRTQQSPYICSYLHQNTIIETSPSQHQCISIETSPSQHQCISVETSPTSQVQQTDIDAQNGHQEFPSQCFQSPQTSLDKQNEHYLDCNITRKIPHTISNQLPQSLTACPVKNFTTYNRPSQSSTVNNQSDGTAMTTKFPIHNLESVLGHGTPPSVSVLKRGLKSVGDTPLQVLVPRVRLAPEDNYQSNFPTDVLNSCVGKGFLERDILSQELQMLPSPTDAEAVVPTNAAGFFNCVPPTTHLHTSAPTHPTLSFDDGHECSSLHNAGHIQQTSLVGSLGNKPYCQQLNNQRIIDGPRVSAGQTDDSSMESGNDEWFSGRSFRTTSYSPVDDTLNPQTCAIPMSPMGVIGSKREIIDSAVCELNQGGSECDNPFVCSSHEEINEANRMSLDCQRQFMSSSMFASQDTTNIYKDFNQHSNQHPNQHSSDNLTGHVCPQYDVIKNNHINILRQSFPNDEEIADRAATDDSGCNMVLRVPKACFVAGFLNSWPNIEDTGRDSSAQSGSSSLDNGQSVGGNDSLQQSSTSTQGLLKFLAVQHGHRDYNYKDLPDYTYLCLGATLFNPVLGLVAFVCNFYARKHLCMHRPSTANNFYFATIAISTVAIFLTLIGGALLIGHKIVIRAEQKELSVLSSLSEECDESLTSVNEPFQMFFNIDSSLFCRIKKNKRVINAMRSYWLYYVTLTKTHGEKYSEKQLGIEDTPQVGKPDADSDNGRIFKGIDDYNDVYREIIGNSTINSNLDAQHRLSMFSVNDSDVYLPLSTIDSANGSNPRFGDGSNATTAGSNATAAGSNVMADDSVGDFSNSVESQQNPQQNLTFNATYDNQRLSVTKYNVTVNESEHNQTTNPSEHNETVKATDKDVLR